MSKYTSYIHSICKQLKEKDVTPADLCSFLSQQLKFEVNAADTVDTILSSLKKKISFLDHEIFQLLVKKYNLDVNHQEMQFSTHFQSYVEKQTVADFVQITPSLTSYSDELDDSVQLTLIFDINSADYKLQQLVSEIKEEVAKCLNVSTLRFHSIKEGSVIATFVLSAKEAMIPSNWMEILKQSKVLKALSLLSASLRGHIKEEDIDLAFVNSGELRWYSAS